MQRLMKIVFPFCVLSTLIIFPCGFFLLSALAINAEEIALTSAPYDHGPPQWSPDGSWIMFTKCLSETSWQIAKISSYGGEEIPLTSVHESPSWQYYPYARWSPDGNWLSYVVETFEEPHFLRRNIYKVASSGEPEIPLKLTANDFADWSPDGNWIAHEGKYPDTAETNFIVGLCKVPATGGANILLTMTVLTGKWQWSPDGAWIAFVSYPNRIYEVPDSGGTEIPLTVEQPDCYGDFDWSPDCAWITYSCFNPYNGGGIYKISSLGGLEIELTDDSGRDPQWSPDGNWIAYCINYWGGIRTVSASGDTIISWTESGEAPQWSPDGNWIVYTKIDSTEYSQVYKVRWDTTNSSGISSQNSTADLPDHFILSQNYPNPFNLECQIQYALPKPCHVELTIYNILGQKVKTLVDEYQDAGNKQVEWDGKTDKGDEVASGVYFYRIETGDFTRAKKMVILK